MTLDSLKDLYIEQLRDLYNAEQQLVEALPKMAEKATHEELRSAINEHAEETRGQRDRLAQVFDNLGEDPTGKKCKAMEGLIQEAEELMSEDVDADVLDAGMIAQAQRVEHYEIAGYGTVATYAERLGRNDDLRLLRETLEEEKTADGKLTRVAEQVANPEAATA